MKKYLELFYFGFYYFEWKAMQNFNKITRPIYGNLLLAIIYIIPYWEKKLARKGYTPEEHVEEILTLGDKIDSGPLRGFQLRFVGRNMVIFFIFAIIDTILIIRAFIGSDWGIIQVNSANWVSISLFVIVMSCVCTSILEETVGSRKTMAKYLRKGKRTKRRALLIFWCSCIIAFVSFFMLLKVPYPLFHFR